MQIWTLALILAGCGSGSPIAVTPEDAAVLSYERLARAALRSSRAEVAGLEWEGGDPPAAVLARVEAPRPLELCPRSELEETAGDRQAVILAVEEFETGEGVRLRAGWSLCGQPRAEWFTATLVATADGAWGFTWRRIEPPPP